MPFPTRRLALASAPLLLAGCGEYRPAVPLEQSVPLALGMLGVTAVPMVAMARWLQRRRPAIDRETGWPLADRAVKATHVAALVAGSIVACPTLLLAGWLVGFSFAEAHIDIFSYADVVGFAAVLCAVVAVLWAVYLGAAGALCSPIAPVRRRARVVCWVVMGVSPLTMVLAVPLVPVLGLLLFTSRRVAPSPEYPVDLVPVDRALRSGTGADRPQGWCPGDRR